MDEIFFRLQTVKGTLFVVLVKKDLLEETIFARLLLACSFVCFVLQVVNFTITWLKKQSVLSLGVVPKS